MSKKIPADPLNIPWWYPKIEHMEIFHKHVMLEGLGVKSPGVLLDFRKEHMVRTSCAPFTVFLGVEALGGGEINSSARGLFRLAQLTGHSSTIAPGACKRRGFSAFLGKFFLWSNSWMVVGFMGWGPRLKNVNMLSKKPLELPKIVINIHKKLRSKAALFLGGGISYSARNWWGLASANPDSALSSGVILGVSTTN